MDKLSTQKQVVGKLMDRRAALSRTADPPGVETALTVDPQGDRFILMDVGWHNNQRVNNVYLHVHLKEGKIWIEEDWTDPGIAGELVEAGIPKEDIVLAFLHPDRRRFSEFAVA